jgi:lipopolysaccharide transport system ATP-binding protein
VVSVQALSKAFSLYASPWHRLQEWAMAGRVVRHQTFWALRGITFEVLEGECLGIIGMNGAGKSTLLKILSRALYPTSGTFSVRGRLVSLLELGTGFNPELSGRQNIFESARLLGFTDHDIRSRIGAILDFAGIGEFVDQPVKGYSSGMFVRLAFAVFANLDPDVYIVDEALTVGDIFFQQKCFKRFRELRRQGCTILFVSHDMEAITHLCDRALLLDGGKIVSSGDARSVVHDYFALVGQTAESERHVPPSISLPAALASDVLQPSPAVREQLESSPPGSHSGLDAGGARIAGFAVSDEEGRPTWTVRSGLALRFWCVVEAEGDLDQANVGIHIYDRRGILVFGFGTHTKGIAVPDLKPGERILCVMTIVMAMQPGEYTLMPQVGRITGEDMGVILDRLEALPPLVVMREALAGHSSFYGLVSLPAEVQVTVDALGPRLPSAGA